VLGGLEWAALGCSSSRAAQHPAAASIRTQQQVAAAAAARGGAKCCPGWARLRGDGTPGSDGRRGGWPRGAKPRGLIPSFPN